MIDKDDLPNLSELLPMYDEDRVKDINNDEEKIVEFTHEVMKEFLEWYKYKKQKGLV